MNYVKVLNWLYYLFLPLLLVFIPLFYRYILSITETKSTDLAGNKYVLFLPAIVVLFLNIFTYINLPYAEKLTILFAGNDTNEQAFDLFIYTGIVFRISFLFVVVAQISFYSYKVFNLLKFHKAIMKKDASYLSCVDIRWLNYIFINLVLFMLISLAFNLVPLYYKEDFLWIFSILMIVSGALIGYLGLKQENLNEYVTRLSYNNNKIDGALNQTNGRIVDLTQSEKTDMLKAIRTLMETKRLYLNSKLSINELSDQLNISKRNISIVINDELGTNIYGFINDYRISESKKIISDSSMAYLSIEGIAQKVGFKSKSSFNACFKRATGKTPTQFRQES